MAGNEQVREKVASATRTTTRRSLRDVLSRCRRLLEALDPEFVMWAEAQLSGDDSVELEPAHAARLAAVLKDIRDVALATRSPLAYSAEMSRRLAAIRETQDAVAEEWLRYTRPVETGYRQIEQVFVNAEEGAKVIVVPVQPTEVNATAFKNFGADLWGDKLPHKVRVLREILESRNRALAPFGWVGLMAVPDFGLRGYQQFKEALAAYSGKHMVTLFTAPRSVKSEGDPVSNAVDALRSDKEQGALGVGANPRVLYYVGDIVVRDGFDGAARPTIDQPLVISPAYACMGAFSRNDRRLGVHAPPAAIKPGSNGDLRVLRVTQEFKDKQVDEAHNAQPQAMNIVFYHPQYKKAFVFGGFISGGRGVNTIGSQRIKDKVTVLMRKLLLEELGTPNVNDERRRAELEQKARAILAYQAKGQALREPGRVTAVKDGTGWRIDINIAPSTIDTAFQFQVEVDETAGPRKP